MTRVVLSEAQREAIARGRFVRVGPVQVARAHSSPTSSLGSPFGGFVVGRVGGRWRAYLNECRHRALPLDLGAPSPMSDDGTHLLCHQHGALYRLDDGLCVVGPCAGERLTPVAVTEDADGALQLDR
jgi:nitrite reductase/ring-hydroxylating ferredoxin subunit